MSVQFSAETLNSEESHEHVRRPQVVPTTRKSLALRLWELLQPLARFWGLLTAIGMVFVISNNVFIN